MGRRKYFYHGTLISGLNTGDHLEPKVSGGGIGGTDPLVHMFSDPDMAKSHAEHRHKIMKQGSPTVYKVTPENGNAFGMSEGEGTETHFATDGRATILGRQWPA